MSQPTRRFTPRYRRRILGIGLLASAALYGIGAPIYNGRIETDLERRVPEELNEHGIDGVKATFSGQDGTLTCEQPLADPESALAVANDVWGVWNIDLDRSCRVSKAPIVETTTTVADTASDTSATTAPAAASTDAAATTVARTTVPATTEPPDFATVADVVNTDPQFSLLAVLTAEADLGDTLSGSGPITLFAPTDAAFESMPADVVAELRADPELLADILRHHIADDELLVADLVDGPLSTSDGGEVTVAIDGETISIDAATIVDGDIQTENGVVHVVDAVLVPDGVDLSAPAEAASVAATLADGVVTLMGSVASEAERAVLVTAATEAIGTESVVDQLVVDAESGADAATVAQVARLLSALPGAVVSGEAGFDGSALYVNGVFADEAGRDALVAVADELSAVATLEPRPDASADDAAALEAELNAFVVANPILFEPTSATLSDQATVVLDQLAARTAQFAGVSFTVEGHTDSDGTASVNQQLSQDRADSVRDALVERGVSEDAIVALGFGSQRPVVVDGQEDKDASRRVEFRVQATG